MKRCKVFDGVFRIPNNFNPSVATVDSDGTVTFWENCVPSLLDGEWENTWYIDGQYKDFPEQRLGKMSDVDASKTMTGITNDMIIEPNVVHMYGVVSKTSKGEISIEAHDSKEKQKAAYDYYVSMNQNLNINDTITMIEFDVDIEE